MKVVPLERAGKGAVPLLVTHSYLRVDKSYPDTRQIHIISYHSKSYALHRGQAAHVVDAVVELVSPDVPPCTRKVVRHQEEHEKQAEDAEHHARLAAASFQCLHGSHLSSLLPAEPRHLQALVGKAQSTTTGAHVCGHSAATTPTAPANMYECSSLYVRIRVPDLTISKKRA
jgi:hypothetical protein